MRKIPLITILCGYCNNPFLTPQWRINQGKGKYCSPEHGFLARRGRVSPNIGKKYPQIAGVNSPHWKGNNVGYMGRHYRIRNQYGDPEFCEGCGSEENQRYEWANISGKYKNDRNDWLRLCVSCHHKFDFKDRPRNEYGQFITI